MGTRFIGPLPTTGPWTAVGLSRTEFLTILGLSVVGFVVIGGPVWRQPQAGHFGRIVLSYGLIVPLVAVVLRREHPYPTGRVLAASALIALAKLIVTTLLLAAIALATR
jgi:hypothetical protein